jgi:Protein of unknown function (DUF3500)/Putative Ig domain
MKPHPYSHRARQWWASVVISLVAMTSAGAVTTAENTAAVVTAANAFLATLSTSQRAAIDSTANVAGATASSVQYNFTLTNAEIWSNLPTTMVTRNGLRFAELSTTQLAAALAVADAAVSSTGTTLMEQIRLADQYISGEVTNSKGTTNSMWGYKKYYIAFVGTPSTTSAWQLQIGGHHLAYNITYNGTYMSCTPMFAASEPNSWTYSGVTHYPLGTMRDLILTLRPTLSTSALLSGTYSDVVMGPNGTGSHDTVQPKSYPTSGRGLLYSSLSTTQQGYVRSYITAWVNHHAGPRAAEMLAIYLSSQALAETYVGYAGSSTNMSTSGSYFRIDGPRVWIEYIVQGGVWDSSGVHDHAVFCDKLADYGAAYGSTTISTTVRPPAISSQPASLTKVAGGSATFSVTAASQGSGTTTLSYQWYKDGTAISGATSSSYTISPVATSDAASYTVNVISTGGLVGSSAATLTVATAPSISTTSLSSGVVGSAYSQTLVATSGTTPYTWSLDSGSLPSGLSLSSAGVISGTPTAAASSSFVVKVTDANSSTATQSLSISVLEPLTVYLNTYSLTDSSADSDGDGVSNLLEFILGGNPVSADTSILPTLSYSSSSSLYTYSFSVPQLLGNTTWGVQYSTDLSTWKNAPSTTDSVTVTQGSATSGRVPVTVTLPYNGDKEFIRVKATAP